MRAVVSAASILALAAGASAAPFQFISFEAGGGVPGIVGQGFQTNGPLGFFQRGGGTDFGSPSLGGLETFADEVDSYFSIDDFGPSVIAGTQSANFYGDYPAPAYNGVDGGVIGDSGTGQAGGFASTAGVGSFIGGAGTENQAGLGLGISPQPFVSGLAPNDGGTRGMVDGVFIGRLTVEGGATIQGGGLFNIRENNATIGQFFELDGPALPLGSQSYQLKSFLVAEGEGVAEGGFFGRTFDTTETYDIWFVVPTPGSLALFGLGGLAALRRRRA